MTELHLSSFPDAELRQLQEQEDLDLEDAKRRVSRLIEMIERRTKS